MSLASKRFWLSSSILSSFVLGSQRFAADLLALIVALFRRFWVCLHVSAVEILVCLRANVFKNMGNSELELVCNRGDPRIILCFKHLFRTSQIQITKFRRQNGQSVALDVKLFELSQLPNLLRQRDQIIISETQYLQLGQLPDVSRKHLKIVVTQIKSSKSGEVEEVSRQRVLGQVVVGKVQHLKSWQRTKSSGQAAQAVHPKVKVFQLLETADLSRQLLDLVVEHVENFQVLQFRDVRRHRCELVVAEDQLSDVRQSEQSRDVQHVGDPSVAHLHLRKVLLPALLHDLLQRLGHFSSGKSRRKAKSKLDWV